MPFIANDPERFLGQSVATGHCVPYVQAASGAPLTRDWRRGVPVKGGNIPRGTAIATFDPDGTYGNHTDGRSHAAILKEEVAGGLLVWDQWRNAPPMPDQVVHERLIRFRAGQGIAVNDGDIFLWWRWSQLTVEPRANRSCDRAENTPCRS